MKVIVSLTSFPGRGSPVVPTIESILNGTVRPDKIVLYLASDQYPGHKIPDQIAELAAKEPIFEVRWTDTDIRSYKKLVPALADFPDDIIITLDDDIIYHPRLVERLLKWHKKYPGSIIAHRAVRARITDGKFLTYRKWKLFKPRRYLRQFPGTPRFDNMATSGGGTLFPPRCLHPDVVKEDVFMKIAPTTDDLWWWVMAMRTGTKTVPVPFGYWKINDFLRGTGQELRTVNVRGRGNDDAIDALSKKYPEIKDKVRNG